jgi:eukaryotic-like serine/threonine-protein kinase
VTPSSDAWIGLEIAEGRYKILGRIGQGSMGRVYLASDHHLETDVVLKFPVAADKAAAGPEFLDRFAREIRSLVQLSHPHVVKVFDVGALEGHPFIVMEFLAGGSLKDRLNTGARCEPAAMPAASLSDWLLEIAKALDFVHAQKHIHREVKPANILFDRHGNAFLGDFGIIKAFAVEETDWRANSLTAPGFLLGTPNYVAPEIVMGRAFDGRVDQYSLAMTVHEVLTGTNCMEGPTPSATVVNQTNRRDQCRVWHRETTMAGRGDRRVSEDICRPQYHGQSARHGVDGGGTGCPRRTQARPISGLVAGEQRLS